MSDNIIEIIESGNYTISIDTSLVQNDNNVTIELIDSNNIDVINNTTVLVGDLPQGYPLSWTSGTLPISRVSGLDIIGGSGINVISNSGIYTVAVTGNFGLTSEEVDDRVNNLLVAGSYTQLNYNDNTDQLTISVTGLQPSGNYSVVGHNHVIADVSGLQTILDNKQPSGNYASSIHSHVSNDITDFNSSVSDLLPVKNISSGSGISVANNSGDFTVSVTGQFGLTSEQVDDRVNSLLVAGNYINLNYDDNLDSLTVSVTGVQQSGNYSVVGHSHIISDVSGLQNALDNKQPSGNYANSVHTHITSDITDFSSGVNSLVSGIYAPLISPDFSGTPTAPTAPSGTNNSQIANTSFVRSEISNLVNSAPSTLDTLNELAVALGNDPNFATTIASGLAQKSNIGHSHSSSEITDFNSSVSGLLPVKNISGSGYVNVSNSSGNFNISVSGLQPSGNYANSIHSHVYTDITNFASGVNNSLTTTLLAGNFINLIYDTNLDTLTIGTSGLQPSGNYSVVGHTHTSSNITDFNTSVSGLLPTVANSGSNRLLTSTGSNVGISAQSNLTFNGSLLNVTGSGSFSNNVAASGFVRTGGTSSQFLKADGTVDSNTYYLNSNPSGYTTNVGTVTNVSALNITTSGTDISSSVANGSTTPVITLNVPSASSSNRGLLSSSDWTTFNNKQPSGNYSIVGHSHLISDVSGLQTALDNKQPSGSYSPLIHNHTSSDITDFNSSVSGLLPVTNITGGSNITVSQSGTNFTVAVTGSLGLTTEEVDDRVSSLLVSGTGISLSYDDSLNSLTISIIKNTILSDVVGSTNYIGSAVEGSSISSGVWTINRTIYDSAGSVSSVGTATNVSWTNRASVSYT